jgi:hypothetical protein
MELGFFFYVISALWAVAMIVNFFVATKMCQAIEARSGRNGAAPVVRLIPVALNRGVAADSETQDLRSQMNRRLLIIVAGFVAFWIFLRLAGPA